MKTLMTMILVLGSVNVMAFSKKADFNFNEGTICSDRSVGKGNVSISSSSEEETKDDSGSVRN